MPPYVTDLSRSHALPRPSCVIRINGAPFLTNAIYLFHYTYRACIIYNIKSHGLKTRALALFLSLAPFEASLTNSLIYFPGASRPALWHRTLSSNGGAEKTNFWRLCSTVIESIECALQDLSGKWDAIVSALEKKSV